MPAGGDWLQVAKPEILRRIAEYSSSELHFSLQALVKNQLELSQSQASAALAKAERVHAALTTLDAAACSDLPPPSELATKHKDALPLLPAPTNTSAATGAGAVDDFMLASSSEGLVQQYRECVLALTCAAEAVERYVCTRLVAAGWWHACSVPALHDVTGASDAHARCFIWSVRLTRNLLLFAVQ